VSIPKNLFKYCVGFSLALVSLLYISSLGQANTYYVAKNGSDNSSGTEAEPWLTIDKAANRMVVGDTVYVKKGTYYESPDPSKSGTAGYYISFLAYPGDVVVIDGQGGSWTFGTGVSYVKIDGFIIRNANILMGPYGGNKYNIISNNIIANAPEIGVDLTGSEGNVIENNEIYGSGHGIHTSGNTKYEVMRGNIIHDNSDNGLGLAWGTGLQVINNIVYNNGKTGIEYSGEDRDGVIRGNLCYNNDVRHVGSNGGWEIFASGSNFVIEGNTAYSRSGAPVTYFIEGSNHVVRNNIGYRSDGANAGVVFLPSSVGADYNDWFDPLNRDPVEGSPGPHTISKDPLFVDVANHDFHLQPNSPCIDAGDPGTPAGYDLDGRSRPLDGDKKGVAIVDMGAYEYPGASPPVKEVEVRNRPNPFRAGEEVTLIEYNLREPSNVTIKIYDLLGQEVWRKSYRAGENGGSKVNSVPWDGRNLSGKVVGNGGYICRVWIEREKRHMVGRIAVAK